MSRQNRWGRVLLLFSAGLFAWAAVITVTGGFRIDVGPVRVSSRDARRLIVLAVLAAAMAWRLAYRDAVPELSRRLLAAHARLDEFLRASSVRGARASVALAWTLAAAVLVCGIVFGSRVAGGADAYGYVSASVLWHDGRLGIDQHALAGLPWPSAEGSFVPLAYRLGTNGVIGPTVAPGLPLLMAAARAFANCGPYLVVPFCASLLTLATFELGRRLFSTGAALAAAALVACSPVMLFQSLVVMADVPAAAFWISALAAALSAKRGSALLSGALAGIALVIRPNLVLLTVFPWSLAISSRTLRDAVRRTALFAAFTVPAALFVAWVNRRLYGSPLTSGYGDVSGAFAIDHATPNIRLYAQWWLESQGAAAFLFFAALWPRRRANRREVLLVIGHAVCAVFLYVFYLPFDQWWYLRFLAPAIPVAFLLCADAVDWVTARSPSLRVAALIALVGIGASHAFRFIASKDILTNSVAERRRYLDAARYTDRMLPQDAIVLAMQHSGSVRYYAGRLVMRWDVLDPAWLDRALASLHERGVPVFALLEPWEEDDFRRRFADQRALTALDTAVARTENDDVRLYTFEPRPNHAAPADVMTQVQDACVDASPHFVYPDALRRVVMR